MIIPKPTFETQIKNHQILITIRKPSPMFTKIQTNEERGERLATTNGGIAGVQHLAHKQTQTQTKAQIQNFSYIVEEHQS